MANVDRYRGNLMGSKGPYLVLGLFQAGATQAVAQGDILELTAATNTKWVPIDSDFAADAQIAVAHEAIASGDLAGYYEIEVPRPGDVWEYALAAATNPGYGDSLYYSGAQVVTTTAGTNVLATVVSQDQIPHQGHVSKVGAGAPDMGTTLGNISNVLLHFDSKGSYFDLILRVA